VVAQSGTEDFDTPDLKEAKTLLEALDAESTALLALTTTSGCGTELPIRNASAPAAIGGKADPQQTTLG
jgi:hypothetical protein